MSEELIIFAKENYFLIGYGITLVISLAYYRRYFDTVLKYFPILITYTFLNELLGYLIKTQKYVSFFDDLQYNTFNDIIYNIYSVVFFAFFYYVYWQLVSTKKNKNWIKYGAVLTLLSFIVSCFFQNPKEISLYYATAFGSGVLVFCILLYFRDKRVRKEALIQQHNLMFWVSIALLIFYSIFPLLYLTGYLDYATWQKYNLRSVLRVLIVIMHSVFIIGFIKGSRHSFG